MSYNWKCSLFFFIIDWDKLSIINHWPFSLPLNTEFQYWLPSKFPHQNSKEEEKKYSHNSQLKFIDYTAVTVKKNSIMIFHNFLLIFPCFMGEKRIYRRKGSNGNKSNINNDILLYVLSYFFPKKEAEAI